MRWREHDPEKWKPVFGQDHAQKQDKAPGGCIRAASRPSSGLGRTMTSQMLTPPELVWLMAAVAKGDQAAFERLYAATRAKLYGVVLRILRRADLADEVMQDTYLKIWRNAGEFDVRLASPMTWMVGIARNRAIDLVRKKAELSIEDEPGTLEVAGDTPDPLARRELTDDLRRLLACLGGLDEERRRMVLLA